MKVEMIWIPSTHEAKGSYLTHIYELIISQYLSLVGVGERVPSGTPPVPAGLLSEVELGSCRLMR